MKGPRLNFHAERELAQPKTTFFSSFLQLRTSSSCCLSLFKEASYTQTTSAEVPVLHTPVEVAEVKWQVYHELPGMYVVRNQAETAEDAESTGEHHRIPQHAIFRFFPDDVVLFDGFI